MTDTSNIQAIRVCNTPEYLGVVDIIVCDEQDQELIDIRICERDEELAQEIACREAAPLTLSGPTEVSTGDVYIASGGVGPYSFFFTGGNIAEQDNKGTIGIVYACNTGTWTTVGGSEYWFPTVYAISNVSGARIDYVSGTTVTSRVWVGRTSTTQSWDLRNLSDDTTAKRMLYTEEPGVYYRLRALNFSVLQKSTNFSCVGTVTVVDSCGNTASIEVTIT